MTTILITGATGTIGRRVTLALAKAGARVRAGVRDRSRAKDLEAAGAELVALDWSDPASVNAAFAGVDHLFLLTPFVEDSMSLVRQALTAARDAGVGHIVRLSAIGADPEASFNIPREHGRGEAAVKGSGIPWTILRPTFFMDNFVSYAAATIKAERRFYGASGAGKASYVSSQDIADVAAKILQAPAAHAGKTYALTGGQAHAGAEVAQLLGELLGEAVTYVDRSPEQQKAALEQQQAPAWMIEGFAGLEGVKRAGGAEAVSPSVEQLLGRPPQTLRAFLSGHLDALR